MPGSQKEIARFKKRLLAIVDGLADCWQERFTGEPLANVLKEFEQFARNYFVYFCTKVEPKTKLSHELNTALGSLQEQWAVISRACEQREIPEFKDRLKDADKQAKEYYERFHGYKADDVKPITYFEKLYAITRYVFTRYPLISIPLQVFNDDTQWQGLAHELGHYIYWNSTELSKYQGVQGWLRDAVLKALSVSTENYDDFQEQAKVAGIWMNWLEETFADVCGTLLAGPTYVISAQRRLEETASTPERIHDDEVHPSLYLRPLIALETLAWVAEQPDASAQKAELEQTVRSLRERWDKHRPGCRRGTHEASDLKMRKIEDRAGAVVRAILGDSKDGDGSGTWVKGDGQAADLGQLIDYKPWLDDWQRVQGEVQVALSPQPTSVAGLAPEPSPEFDALVEYLKKERRYTDKQVRETLLSLELKEEEFISCTWRKVKWVGYGKGYYKRCS